MKDDKRMHWVFDHNADDVRGWEVRDHDRNLVGTVRDMLVDPQTQYVTAVVLVDGERITADHIQLGDHVLFVAAPPTIAEAAPPVAASPPVAAPRPVASESDDIVVEIVSEELDVGTRRYAAGGIHLETHVVAEPIERDVRLKDEHVSVERTKVDRVLGAAEADRLLRDATVEMTARSEVPVVTKQVHVVEELVIKKAGTSRDEIVHDTVRQMDAAITEVRAEAFKGGAR